MNENLSDTNVGNIEYIRRQDAFDAVDARIDELMAHPEYRRKRWDIDLSGIIRNISAIKPADVAPVVHGRWIKYTGMGKEQWMCSECSAEEKNPKIARYCYYCGAKMDAQGEE